MFVTCLQSDVLIQFCLLFHYRLISSHSTITSGQQKLPRSSATAIFNCRHVFFWVYERDCALFKSKQIKGKVNHGWFFSLQPTICYHNNNNNDKKHLMLLDSPDVAVVIFPFLFTFSLPSQTCCEYTWLHTGVQPCSVCVSSPQSLSLRW